MKRPKLETVANKAGVSVATVSQVLNGTGRISEKTRAKVLNAASELQYVPDGRAASMRSGDLREIGMIIHFIANPFNAEVISGVSDTLEANDYLVSVLDSQDNADRQRRNLEAFIRSSRGGLLWVPAQNTPDDTIDLLRTHNIPTVTFLREPYDTDFDHVGIENTQATQKATEHLIELGHTKIAYFGGTDLNIVRQSRINGYQAALKKHGLENSLIWDAQNTKSAGLSAMLELREKHPEITGIVCNGDVVALGACHALRRRNEIAGQDVSVIGFDDIQDALTATPPLTTMTVKPYDLGVKLANTLLSRIKAPDAPITSTFMPAELTIRDTTKAV